MLQLLSDADIEHFIEEGVPYGDLTTMAGVDVLQLDKIPLDQLSDLSKEIKAIAPGTKVSAAGGINESNVADYAAAGVDIIVLSSVCLGKPAAIGVKIITIDRKLY